MRRLIPFLGVVWSVALLVSAQESPSPAPPEASAKAAHEELGFPAAPFDARFARIVSIDAAAGKVQVVAMHGVPEARIGTRTITEVAASGRPVSKTVTYGYHITKPVFETRVVPLATGMIGNPAGKKMPLAEAVKKVDLKGRDVLLAESDLDPYYLKALAPSMLILIVPREEFPVGPLPEIPPAPAPPAPPLPPAP